MSDEQNFVDHTRPISIRFTADEAEFINENYERITDTPERVTNRDFFFSAVQKAVSRIAPKASASAVDVTPYTKEIEMLRAQLAEANALLESKQIAIDEITQRNVELDQDNDRSTELIAELERQINENNRREQAMEAASRVKEGALILEDMQPVETALVMEYARIMQTTPKVVLVEKLFTPTVWHGPGDYIPRLNSAAKRKIREAFQ